MGQASPPAHIRAHAPGDTQPEWRSISACEEHRGENTAAVVVSQVLSQSGLRVPKMTVSGGACILLSHSTLPDSWPKRPLSKPENLCHLRPSSFCPLPVSSVITHRPTLLPKQGAGCEISQERNQRLQGNQVVRPCGRRLLWELFSRALSFAGTAAEGMCVTCTWTTGWLPSHSRGLEAPAEAERGVARGPSAGGHQETGSGSASVPGRVLGTRWPTWVSSFSLGK